MSLEKLLTPGLIGTMELNNRLVFAPIATRGADPEGVLSDALSRFYEERAKGGMALSVNVVVTKYSAQIGLVTPPSGSRYAPAG